MRFEQRLDLPWWIAVMRSHDRVPVLPHLAPLFTQIFGHQVVLGRKAAIETHLVGAGFGGNGVDPYAADAMAVEQLAGGIENPIAHARLGAGALGFLPGGIIIRSVHFLTPVDTI